jgi:hypothetical protein
VVKHPSPARVEVLAFKLERCGLVKARRCVSERGAEPDRTGPNRAQAPDDPADGDELQDLFCTAVNYVRSGCIVQRARLAPGL